MIDQLPVLCEPEQRIGTANTTKCQVKNLYLRELQLTGWFEILGLILERMKQC